MHQTQRVTIPETETVTGITWWPTWLTHVVVLAALALSGCRTTAEFVGEGPNGHFEGSGAGTTTAGTGNPPVRDTVKVVRLQSPAGGPSQEPAAPVQPGLPPLPDPGLPSTALDANEPALAQPPPDDPATNPPGAAATVIRPQSGAVVDPNSAALQGLSSIARNRLRNRQAAAPLSNSGVAPWGAPAGGTATGSVNTRTSGMSSILRNRVQGEAGAEGPQFDFPDLRAEPADIYRDRFGLVEEAPDRFLFPWLVNLIFEDRWLLDESDPARALQNQLRRRLKIDIRDPDPDTANFPNGAYTIPKGRLYIENSPVGFYGASKSTPATYQWESLIRYGLTDNLEFRIFTNGFSAQAKQGKQGATTGFSPLAFDFKANFWEENTKYHLPAMGAEIYLQTTFGSPAFNSGTQPSMSLLFDQTLPLGINFEYNIGITGLQNSQGQTVYEFSYQWSFQRQVVKDFDVFVQGFYNAAALPRLLNFDASSKNRAIPNANVVGVGGIWTVNDRLAIFGSFNFGTTSGAPKTIALTGFAVAF